MPDKIKTTSNAHGKDDFLQLQLLPAAVIDSALTCLVLTIVWSVEFLLVNLSINFLHMQALGKVFNVLSLATPLVAPLIYQLLWTACGYNCSPGKLWLNLNWLIRTHSSTRELWLDLGTGLLAVVASSALGVQLVAFINTWLRHSGFKHFAPLALSTICVMLLTYHCTYLILMLWRYCDQYKKTLVHLKHQPDGHEQIMVLTAPIALGRPAFARRTLAITILGLVPVQLISSLLFLPFFQSIVAYTLLTFPLIALVQGAVILKYWQSPMAIGLYCVFYAMPAYLSVFVFPYVFLYL